METLGETNVRTKSGIIYIESRIFESERMRLRVDMIFEEFLYLLRRQLGTLKHRIAYYG